MSDQPHVLIIRGDSQARIPTVTYGPFETRLAAEYAAMDYYGTAITGASARDAFLITELRSWDTVGRP